MTDGENMAGMLLDRVLATPRAGRRRLVALAGPPASGKSTLAEHLADLLSRSGCAATVVPMDGFHLDNRILDTRGLRHRKGSPASFDVSGLLRLVAALASDDEVFFPTFDRRRDLAIAGSGLVGPTCDTAIVEGNYLLYDAPGWRDLSRLWDLSIRLEVPRDTLEARLVDRWLAQGHTQTQAEARARENDLANATLLTRAALPADVTLATAD